MTGHLYYYAKAYYAAIAAGFLYLATVIGPDITVADLAHVSLLHWIGFIGSILGVGAGTAAITNGAKPAPQNTDGSYTITDVPAVPFAPATSFAATQAKINALPVAVPEADYVPLDKPVVDPLPAADPEQATPPTTPVA